MTARNMTWVASALVFMALALAVLLGAGVALDKYDRIQLGALLVLIAVLQTAGLAVMAQRAELRPSAGP